jgi:aspartyl aminopeptidase
MAILDAVCLKRQLLLVDKEEIGSEACRHDVKQLRQVYKQPCAVRMYPFSTAFANSFFPSADVCNAYDPNFP